MSFLSILKDILIPTLIATLCLTAVGFIFVIIPEKFREKEGKPTRHGLEPIQMSPEGMALMLTSDRTTFYPIPPRCRIFAMITKDGCLIQLEDEREPRLIPLRYLSVIPTGVDGVPFMVERPILRYSIFARGDRYVGTKYQLYVPNLAISPEDRHLVWWPIVRGESSTKPLHSTREGDPVTREVCFVVKGFDGEKALLYLYDEDEKIILSEEKFVADSDRICQTCNIGGIVSLSLRNYIIHC